MPAANTAADLNKVKLRRLIEHIEGNGSVDYDELIKQTRLKRPETLLEYVEAAAAELNRPRIVEWFRNSATAAGIALPGGESESSEPATESTPADATTPAAPSAPDNGNGGISDYDFAYRDGNGVLHDLVVLKVKGRRAILQDRPVEQVVEILLRGQRVRVDMAKLRALPADETVVPESAAVGALAGDLLRAAELAR